MNPTYRIASTLVERARKNARIAAGPFKGARTTLSARSYDWNKLMGLYEFYLHDYLEDAIAAEPPLCIDVGAAEGYYTLGLAHRLPKARHIAYEMLDEQRLSLLSNLSGLGVPVELKGECTHETLLADVRQSEEGFLIMDCEGGEQSLLTDAMHNALKRWHVLLEVHDYHAPGAGDRIYELFSSSHKTSVRWSRDPLPCDLSLISPWPLNHLCCRAFRSMFNEGRGCSMRFFYFSPQMA